MFCIALILVSCSKDNDSDTQTGSGKVLEKKITKIIISGYKQSDTLKLFYTSDNQLESIDYYHSIGSYHNGSYSILKTDNTLKILDINSSEDSGTLLSCEMDNGKAISIDFGKSDRNFVYTDDGYLGEIVYYNEYSSMESFESNKFVITDGMLLDNGLPVSKEYKFEYSNIKNNLNLDIFYFLFGNLLLEDRSGEHEGDNFKIASLCGIFGKRFEYLPSKGTRFYSNDESGESESHCFDYLYSFDGDYISKIEAQGILYQFYYE